MSIIKSFAVGNGDMFYIDHNSNNFTIIDCCLNNKTGGASILKEVAKLSKNKEITRFISTHPDEDHIKGLEYLDNIIRIQNFYCVGNNVKKKVTPSFKRYRELMESPKAFHISEGCRRYWMNLTGKGRGSSGINILWPDLENEKFQEALRQAEKTGKPNKISPIIKYSLEDGVTALWMGDLETDFMELIEKDLDLTKIDILFAAHHGRKTGRIPKAMLEKMEPQLIIIGEAKSEEIYYYPDYDTITQNSAGTIVFDCLERKVRIFSSDTTYSVGFLNCEPKYAPNHCYLGTLTPYIR